MKQNLSKDDDCDDAGPVNLRGSSLNILGPVMELDVLQFVGSYEAYGIMTKVVSSGINRNNSLVEQRKRFLYDLFDLCQWNLEGIRHWLHSNREYAVRVGNVVSQRIPTRTFLEWQSQLISLLTNHSNNKCNPGRPPITQTNVLGYLIELCHRDHGLSRSCSDYSPLLERLQTDFCNLVDGLKKSRCLISDVDLLQSFLESLDVVMDHISKKRRGLCSRHLKEFIGEAVIVLPRPVLDKRVIGNSSNATTTLWTRLLLEMMWKLLSIGVVDPKELLVDFCKQVLKAFRDYFYEGEDDGDDIPSENEEYLYDLLWGNVSFQTIMRQVVITKKEGCFRQHGQRQQMDMVASTWRRNW